jgi:hypothetical protein
LLIVWQQLNVSGYRLVLARGWHGGDGSRLRRWQVLCGWSGGDGEPNLTARRYVKARGRPLHKHRARWYNVGVPVLNADLCIGDNRANHLSRR